MLNNYRISQKLQCNGIKQELSERTGQMIPVLFIENLDM
jgi:hypothetical protein